MKACDLFIKNACECVSVREVRVQVPKRGVCVGYSTKCV